MIRKFNYTERKRITKERVVIQLDRTNGAASFSAKIDLAGVVLPGGAKIYIEPYFKAATMRFPFGTVAEITPPADRVLTRIPQPELAFFRFKVVDESEYFGRLLASADRLMPLIDVSEPSGQTCIFRVNVTDTGKELWRFDLDESGPILEINRSVEGIKDIARADTTFLTCVYPSLVRQVPPQNTFRGATQRSAHRLLGLAVPVAAFRVKTLRYPTADKASRKRRAGRRVD